MDINNITDGSLIVIGDDIALVLEVVSKGTHKKKGTDSRDWINIIVQQRDFKCHYQIGGHRFSNISDDIHGQIMKNWRIPGVDWIDAGIVKFFE